MAKRRISSLIISASIWTLIQSVVNLVVSSLGITAYRCGYDMTANSVEYTIYVLYFFNPSCGSMIDLELLAPSSQGFAALVVTPFTVDSTLRWLIIHLTIACLWIVTSFLMMVGSLNRVYGGYSLLFSGPWLLCASLAIFADGVASITYITDIPQTTDARMLLNYIGAVFTPSTVQDGTNTWSAAAIMAIYFARGFIFWVANVFFLLAVIRETRRIVSQKRSDEPPSNLLNQQNVLNNSAVVNENRNWTNDMDVRSNQMLPEKLNTTNNNWLMASNSNIDTINNYSPLPSPTRLKPTLSERQGNMMKDNALNSLTNRLELVIDNNLKHNNSFAESPGIFTRSPVENNHSNSFRTTNLPFTEESLEKPASNDNTPDNIKSIQRTAESLAEKKT